MRPRRGELTVIAGRPGQGKSLLALTLAIRLGLPCLFFSADSSPATVVARAAAALTGKSVDVVESDPDAPDVAAATSSLNNIRWVFDPAPSVTDIDLELAAHVEMEGQPPQLIIVDNLVNCETEVDGEFYGLSDLLSTMHVLARDTDAAVIVLHHTTESKQEGAVGFPQGSSAVIGKVNRLPALILTVALHHNEFRVASVKNRHGRADPSGHEYVTLYADLPRMTLHDSRQSFAAAAGRQQWT